MNNSFSSAIVASVVSICVLLSCSDDVESQAAAEDLCTQYCAAETNADCPSSPIASCSSFCADIRASGHCLEEWNAVFQCTIDQGFSCGPEGNPMPSTSQECEAENTALNECE
jgi:hypothetical protein